MSNKTIFFLQEVKKMLGESIGKIENMKESRDSILDAFGLWIFSAAFNASRKKDYLISATNEKEYFLEHFTDHKFGGVYKSVDGNGEREDITKYLDAQAYAIYALCEFYCATGDDEALKAAKNIAVIVEKEFKKGDHYANKLNRDFSALDDEFNLKAHLHLLEAYTSLYKVAPEAGLEESLSKLAVLVMGRTDEACGCMAFETSWKLIDCAFALKDIDLVNKSRKKALELAAECKPKCCTSEAESIICNLWLWKYCGKEDAADKALQGWEELKKLSANEEEPQFHVIRTCIEVLQIF